MDLGVIKNVISALAKRPEITFEALEELINFNQIALIKRLMEEYFKAGMNDDALKPFRIDRRLEADPFVFVGGIAQVPSDLMRDIEMSHLVDGIKRRVELVDIRKWYTRHDSNNEFPTYRYAIANLRIDIVLISPNTIQFTNFSYFRRPVDVKFAITQEHGFSEYTPVGSIQLEWMEEEQIDIVLMVLQALGVSATRGEVKEASKQ